MPESKFRRSSPSASSPASTSANHDGVLSVLSNAIETADIVKDLVPLDLVKGVLSAVVGVLTLVKNTIRNRDDFAQVINQCYEIELVLWRATSGTPESEISPAIVHAISELKNAIDGIQATIIAKAQRGIAPTMLSVSIDRENIAAWKQDLDHILHIFNAELNLIANVKLSELVSMFEELRSNIDAKQNTAQRDFPPAKPALLFGRDTVVHETVESLLKHHHVALIGPGGMGKTSIAKAVINDEKIAGHFKDHRYFVPYDDVDASQISVDTFSNRIARVLGLSVSKANLRSSIMRYLTSNEMLLVLDNAETFLDAAQDAGRIAQAIDDFGALRTVAIMLTSRSRGLPPNLLCSQLSVPPLEQDPAYEAFTAVYHTRISPAIVSRLLSALDFHPLSINLLAQAAVQNEWSPDELIDSWERQQASVLNNGGGKLQSLAATIELSLNSPSVKRLGAEARHFLQIVAFLPQGVDRRKLTDLFPTIPNIHFLVDTLCKHSLTYRNEYFIMILAPIRLYISTTYNGPIPYTIPLLAGVRSYYYDRLAKSEPDGGSWIKAEDVNIERLIALDLTVVEAPESACTACTQFIDLLILNYLRPVALHSTILNLPECEIKRFKWRCFCSSRPHTKSLSLVLKACCLKSLGLLSNWLGNYAEEAELLVKANELFLQAKEKQEAIICMTYVGDAYTALGQFVTAEEVLADVLKMSRDSRDRHAEARAQLSLGGVKMFRGKSEALELFARARNYFEGTTDTYWICCAINWQGFGELYLGDCAAARRSFEAQMTLHTSQGDDSGRAYSIESLAGVAMREGSISEARQLLRDAREVALNANEIFASSILSISAALAADQGDFELARDQGNLAVAEMTTPDGRISENLVWCLYISARTELLAQQYSKATELFLTTKEYCEALSDIRFRARSLRALGEIALREHDLKRARELFSQAKAQCDSMGISPKHLYICFGCYALNDSFEGWNLFQEGRLPPA